jgi:hypothetical protein
MIDLADLPCTDCGYGTINNEYYMVRNAVWERALGHPIPNFDDTILCIGCLERRIGRTLTRFDFTNCPLNEDDPDWSERLRDRMKRGRRIDFVLTFAEVGFPIFPVNVFRRGDRWRKVPYVKDWENAATTDPEILREWWLRWPTAMPGLPLERCGLVVVDCDRHGEVDGVAAFRELGLMPRHPIVTTKSGGQHHWFRQPPSPVHFTKWAGGEVLGNGRFVVGYSVPQGVMPELPKVFWPREEDSIVQDPLECVVPDHHRERSTYRRTLNPRARIQSLMRGLEHAARGARNHRLNTTAYIFGRMIVEGCIRTRRDAEWLLRSGAWINGLWQEDGAEQCKATMKSGLDAGIQDEMNATEENTLSGSYTTGSILTTTFSEIAE